MNSLLDAIRDRLLYGQSRRAVSHSLSGLTHRQLDDIGVHSVLISAHEAAVKEVAAAQAERAARRAAGITPDLRVTLSRREAFYPIG